MIKVQRQHGYVLKNLTPHQTQQLLQTAGCCRWVWNHALAICRARYDKKEPMPSYTELCLWLTAWKEDYPWLRLALSQSLQQTLKTLRRAISEFYTKPERGFPKPKSRNHTHPSFCVPQGFIVNEANGRIRIPKVGWLQYRNREWKLNGMPKQLRLLYRHDHWEVCISIESETEVQPAMSGTSVGLDKGVEHTLTTSNGEFFDMPDTSRIECHIKHLQKKLARQKKKSNNWRKTKRKINRLHHKLACIRRDFCHKSSTTLAKNHSKIVVEDLKVTAMTKSAKGTVENPGKQVKQKAGLNRVILASCWGQLDQMLAYKVAERGGVYTKVPAAYTSQKCSSCGFTASKNRRTQAKFKCASCGYTDNADINAAKNILAAGHATTACGEVDVSPSVKQEPSLISR